MRIALWLLALFAVAVAAALFAKEDVTDTIAETAEGIEARIADMQAAIGVEQLRKLPGFIQAISSPMVSTFHPGNVGVSMARLVPRSCLHSIVTG